MYLQRRWLHDGFRFGDDHHFILCASHSAQCCCSWQVKWVQVILCLVSWRHWPTSHERDWSPIGHWCGKGCCHAVVLQYRPKVRLKLSALFLNGSIYTLHSHLWYITKNLQMSIFFWLRLKQRIKWPVLWKTEIPSMSACPWCPLKFLLNLHGLCRVPVSLVEHLTPMMSLLMSKHRKTCSTILVL